MAKSQITGFPHESARTIRKRAGSIQTRELFSNRPRSRGNSRQRLFQTPTGGIAALAGTAISSAECTEFKIVSGTLTTNTKTELVYNPWPVAIPANFFVLAVKESASGLWIAMSPGVINVRWNDPDLEQTLNGTDYINIDTAEDCS